MFERTLGAFFLIKTSSLIIRFMDINVLSNFIYYFAYYIVFVIIYTTNVLMLTMAEFIMIV